MAGEKYGDKAVAKLLAWVQAQLPAQLRLVETAQSLTTNSLTDPVDYVAAKVPEDYRSPLIQIYCDDGDSTDPMNSLYRYRCTVHLGYCNDADPVGGQLFMRRYMTAMLDTIRTDRTFSGTVVMAIEGSQSFGSRKANSTTVYENDLAVEITTRD